MKWLRSLFHLHRWEIRDEVMLKVTYTDLSETKGRRYYLRCAVCGDVKCRDFI